MGKTYKRNCDDYNNNDRYRKEKKQKRNRNKKDILKSYGSYTDKYDFYDD